ncbi:hypothetical protein [Rhodohalobacter sp. 8-1]|uniref:hypothetical protein n=1 Tax=Rhodohalobacter sp. 8-1 TaxID=3131972 RepID=UPI0030EE2009
MKKVLLIITTLLFTAFSAFAQSNEATLSQIGDDNTATIDQVGDLNYTSLTQEDGATADIDQIDASSSFVSLSQIGSSSATIFQTNKNSVQGFTDQWNTPAASKLATQEGSGNTMDITQLSEFNQAYVDQFGDNNSMSILQDGGISNIARILQDGTGNSIDVDLIGSINRVNAQQYGVGNSATVSVTGDKNNEFGGTGSSYIYQDGMDHTATVTLMGDENFYDISQMGSAQTATVTATGNGNSAVITQSN